MPPTRRSNGVATTTLRRTNGNADFGLAVSGMPHIDDLVYTDLNLGPEVTMKKLLDEGLGRLSMAKMQRDYKKDLAAAMRDYVLANVVLYEVPRHREYASVSMREKRTLTAMLDKLRKDVDAENEYFQQLKEAIKEDNALTGVKPTVQRPAKQTNGAAKRPAQSQSKPAAGPGSQQAARNPQTMAEGNGRHDNLVARFQGLRPNRFDLDTSDTASDTGSDFASMPAAPTQDPRIKTRPIVPLKPAGPRAMSSITRPAAPAVETRLPDLPRPPDAIYSPARGTVSNEAAQLPSSTGRGLFSRTPSNASVAGASALRTGEDASMGPPKQIPLVPPKLNLPRGTELTPDELVEIMKQKVTLLLIDVRDRDQFDGGHIMASSIICIEPNVLMRDRMTAHALEETMVLAPEQEEGAFAHREKYELVVMYDQSSDYLPEFSSPDTPGAALLQLHRALTQLSWDKQLKRRPMILKGGLDAWIDTMGPYCLAESSTTQIVKRRTYGPKRTVAMPGQKRRASYLTKPLNREEAKSWQDTLDDTNRYIEESAGYSGSMDEFLRRFPSVQGRKESMTTYETSSTGRSDAEFISDLGPAPPRRPAPAVPRPSYSGLSETSSDSTGATTPRVVAKMAKTGSEDTFYTGLANPGNWCYANSVIQVLRASTGFLSGADWLTQFKVPKKALESIEPPQLMARILYNQLNWMKSAKFKVMKANTLMDYSKHLCQKGDNLGVLFGGSEQQDCQEFFSFIMQHIHDETNTLRDQDQARQKQAAPQPGRSLLQQAQDYWADHLTRNNSMITQSWRGVECAKLICSGCNHESAMFNTNDILAVPCEDSKNVGHDITLEECIRLHLRPEALDEYTCQNCKAKGTVTKENYLARMPDMLTVCLKRFAFHKIEATRNGSASGRTEKIPNKVTWDLNNLDLGDFFLSDADCQPQSGTPERQSSPPFQYECYAVIVHRGRSLNHGHYYAYVRNTDSSDKNAWRLCNDADVSDINMGPGIFSKRDQQVFKHNDALPYMAFFRRKGAIP